ncbi:MAG: glutamate racemase [Endomicrobium sp.]|jgi:glutamate racemase|nr:glutamate racemase [Endomicrobium sp.]
MQVRVKNKLNNNQQQAIGIFDSGFGGLGAVLTINQILPYENIIYLGDTANVPYGSKSKETIIKYAKKNSLFLMNHKVKIIIIACNTVSAFALSILRKIINIPIIDIITPGIKLALSVSKNKRIGVVGTRGTISTKIYPKKIKKEFTLAKVYQKSCPLLVPLIEEYYNNNKVINIIIKDYFKSILKHNIDTLILGCTHYSILKKKIRKNLNNNVIIVDPIEASVMEVANNLKFKQIHKNTKEKIGQLTFYVTDNPKKFQSIGNKIFKGKIKLDNVIKTSII